MVWHTFSYRLLPTRGIQGRIVWSECIVEDTSELFDRLLDILLHLCLYEIRDILLSWGDEIIECICGDQEDVG
jgi:hypothetical protein